MLQKVILRFDNQIYKVEMPVEDKMTGQIALVFHYKEGQLMKSEIQKSSKVSIDENTLSTGIEVGNAV